MDFLLVYLNIVVLFLYYIINYIYNFYRNVQKYPPGPMPIPVFGNILIMLRIYILISKRNMDVYTALYKIGHKYGKMFTLWIGSKPAVIILDLDIGKQAFRMLDFSDRPVSSIDKLISAKDCKSFVFQDYTREAQYLRKFLIESLRQVHTGNKLSVIVNKQMSETVNIMKTKENGKQFYPKVYIENIILGTILELTFGEKINFGGSQLKFIAHKLHLFNDEGMKYIITDFVPITKYFLKTTEQSKAEINKLTELYKNKYEHNLKSYKTGSIDNICDSMNTVREELTKEGKRNASLLTEGNLIGVINTLITGATDTLIATMKWQVLLMSCYPEMQAKMRNEINEKIGKRVPELTDKINCHFVNAFICETLRIRNAVPIGLYHKTSNNVTIGEYSIPKNTVTFLHQMFILNNRKFWSEPEIFNPNRFLDSSGKFSTVELPAFIPFSVGRRMCPGDKMANSMLFLCVTNFLQQTNGYQVLLANEKRDADFKPNLVDYLITPLSYEIILKQI